MTKAIIYAPEAETNSRIMKKDHLCGKYNKYVLEENDPRIHSSFQHSSGRST